MLAHRLLDRDMRARQQKTLPSLSLTFASLTVVCNAILSFFSVRVSSAIRQRHNFHSNCISYAFYFFENGQYHKQAHLIAFLPLFSILPISSKPVSIRFPALSKSHLTSPKTESSQIFKGTTFIFPLLASAA